MNSKIQNLLSQVPQDVDAVIIKSDMSRLYFTQFRSSAGTLFITREEAYLFIDSRYIEAAKMGAVGCQVILSDNLSEQMEEVIRRHHVKRIALEDYAVTLNDYRILKEQITSAELILDSKISAEIYKIRMMKTPEEIKIMEEVMEITDKVFTHILNFIKPGKTEREISLEMERFAKVNGAEGLSFPAIVVGGPNSSRPHGVPGDRPLQNGDFLTMDFGYLKQGYCSDMTRTIAIGDITEEMHTVYETVLKAHNEAMKAIKPEVPCSEIDKVARDIITQAGYGEYFGHSLGHSLGLEIHESPRFVGTDHTITKPGMIITDEPGIYLPGRFGVRIEDMVLITEDGHRSLAHSKKELITIR